MKESNQRITPVSVDVASSDGLMHISWADGKIHSFSLFGLRKNCPCVMCRGGHELMDQFEPGFFLVDRATLQASSIQILQIIPVGHHALRIFWSDGHNEGMYRYENLRYWGDWIEEHRNGDSA